MNWVIKSDSLIIRRLKRISVPFARLAIFTVYFWFGALKVLGARPAGPLVAALLQKTLPFLTSGQFIFCFGIFEMAIGLMFIVPGLERIAIPFLILHMITTVGPLFLLPQLAWQGWLIPTLEGQYIIKNLAIIACAIFIAIHLKPLRSIHE